MRSILVSSCEGPIDSRAASLTDRQRWLSFAQCRGQGAGGGARVPARGVKEDWLEDTKAHREAECGVVSLELSFGGQSHLRLSVRTTTCRKITSPGASGAGNVQPSPALDPARPVLQLLRRWSCGPKEADFGGDADLVWQQPRSGKFWRSVGVDSTIWTPRFLAPAAKRMYQYIISSVQIMFGRLWCKGIAFAFNQNTLQSWLRYQRTVFMT